MVQLISQFELWEDGTSQLESMVEDANHNLKLQSSKLCGNCDPDKLTKINQQKLSSGGICSTVYFITNHKGGGVIFPDKIEE